MHKILHRYLFRQNIYYLGLILVSGISIYLLIDFLDLADKFISADASLGVILKFYLYKTPLIISQILPAVFLLSIVLQLGMMSRNRELLSLKSNSITLRTLTVFFVCYSFFWGCGQFVFSQYLGATGKEKSEILWKEEVRDKDLSKRALHDLWFREGHRFVRLDRVVPEKGTGRGIDIYEVENDSSLSRVIRAESFSVTESGWRLENVRIASPQEFSSRQEKTETIAFETDIRDFLQINSDVSPHSLSLFRLGDLIDKLSNTGSNVERLRTLWHSKLSYAASLIVMAFIGMALITLTGNIYVLVLLSLALVFIYYAGFVLGTGFGESGLLPPMAAAWASNIFLAIAAATVIIFKTE